MSEALLSKTDDRGICTLTLNRPERHNAFDSHLIEQLRARFGQIDRDASVGVVVLTGAGASFSSGADLEWMRGMVGYDETTIEARFPSFSGLSLVVSSSGVVGVSWESCWNVPCIGSFISTDRTQT